MMRSWKGPSSSFVSGMERALLLSSQDQAQKEGKLCEVCVRSYSTILCSWNVEGLRTSLKRVMGAPAFSITNQVKEGRVQWDKVYLLLTVSLASSCLLPLLLCAPVLSVPTLMFYLSSVHSGMLASTKAARYCCKTPRILFMNPLESGKRGNPMSG